MKLETPVSELTRVGKTAAKYLHHLGIETVRDLLLYFPFRYEDFRTVVAMRDAKDGEQVTVKGKIELIANKRSPRKRKIITEAVVSDESGRIRVVWFGQPFITKVLKAGDTVYFSGKVTTDMFGTQMVGPVYEKDQKSTTHTARIVPMYPLTSGLTQKQLRFLIKQVVHLVCDLDDWLPDDIRDRADVMPLSEAIRAIHFPESDEELKHAERRLKFDELFILQLRSEMVRRSLERATAPSISFREEETKHFVTTLPFTLTKAQKIAAWEILQDLQKAGSMNRLLEGDVGSGKTVVAAMALLNTVRNGYQGVMMAPTEILAKQHYASICRLLADHATIAVLTHSEFSVFNFQFSKKSKSGQKQELIDKIKEGAVDIIIGTHALLQGGVAFKNLGVVIVDEQHRFGVEQRKVMREKSGHANVTPHFLSMTATPIPRSLALAIYGDLDVSIINEMPVGRKPVKTRVVEPRHREKAYQFIREQVGQGRQVFVICPLIEKEQGTINNWQLTISDEKKSVLSEFEKLSKHVFPDLRVGYLHGKMKAKEKDETMKKFSGGELDILVSTSVVEVGVDIPNASVIMIEGAERFGLAQLHQFRGRVGRSTHQSYCFLFTESDSLRVRERLKFFEANTDGFKIAEYDLEQRGPGEVYGTAQSGMMQLRFATLKDVALIKLARELAQGIDIEFFPTLRAKLCEWEGQVHLE